MAWIRTIKPEEDETVRRAMEQVRALYPAEYHIPVQAAGAGDKSGGIVQSHSLIPEALLHAFSTFGVLMSADLPLTRAQQEMIATVVSFTNRCRYCSESHAEFLRRVCLNDELVIALRNDHTKAPISQQD